MNTDLGGGGAVAATTTSAPAGGAAPPPSSAPNGASGTPAPGGSFGSGIPNAGASAADWTSSLNPEIKGYVQAKGFKDVGAIADSYRNLEKLLGAGPDKLLKLPEKADAPEWNDIYSKLGKPADKSSYKIPIGDGETEDKEFTDFVRTTFHEANLTSEQAERVATKWSEFTRSRVDTATKESQSTILMKQQQEKTALQNEWGKAFEQNVNIGREAARAFGVAPEMIDKLESAMGFQNVMKFMHSIGSKLGHEGKFVEGVNQNQNGFGALTPDVARNKIAELKADKEFVGRMWNGDTKAKAEWNRLHEFAFPGAVEQK